MNHDKYNKQQQSAYTAQKRKDAPTSIGKQQRSRATQTDKRRYAENPMSGVRYASAYAKTTYPHQNRSKRRLKRRKSAVSGLAVVLVVMIFVS